MERKGPFASGPGLVLACPSYIAAEGVASPGSPSATEVVKSGFIRLRTRAATAVAAAASKVMPISLRKRRAPWLRGLDAPCGRGQRGRDLGCDAVLQHLPGALGQPPTRAQPSAGPATASTS